MGRMLAWGGIVLGAVYLIYIGGAWWGIYASGLRVATMLIAAVTLAIWAWVAYRNPAWRPKSVMLPAILACLGSLAISTVFSRVPRVSLEYLGYAIVLAALYLLLVRLFADRFFQRRLAVLATLLFAFTTIAFLVRVTGYWVEWWTALGRFALPPLRPGFEGLTFNNPSAVLTMVALLGVPVVGMFGGTRRRGLLTILGVVATVAVVGLISGSRSGWFALGLTGLIAPVAWLASARNREVVSTVASRTLASTTGRVAVGAGLIAVAVALVVIAPAILRRASEGGENLRIGYAVTAIRMFLDAPLFGGGPGTWVIFRGSQTLPPEVDYYIPHAHNLEVQVLAELGIVGALAGVVLVANVLWLLRDAVRGADPVRRRWAWATAIGLLYFVLHQVLDFYVNMPAFLFAAALPIAYLDATSAEPMGAARRRTAIGGRGWVAAALCVAIAIVGLTVQEIPAGEQARAVEAANNRDWVSADAPARAAAAAEPDIGSYQLTAGLTAARAGDHEAAARYFERVAVRDDLPEAWLNLAAEQGELGRADEAIASIGRALRLGEQRPVVAMPAGELAVRLGARDLATRAFAFALFKVPSLAADPWWRENRDRSAAFDAALPQAIEMTPSYLRWELALMAGDTDQALRLAEPAVGGQVAMAIVQAWMGDATAADSLIAACKANPLDLYRLLWCARVEEHRGNNANAHELRLLANISLLSSYTAGAEMRVSPAGMVGRQLVGDPADLWATYTYRRPAPWDILVPSLIHLKVE